MEILKTQTKGYAKYKKHSNRNKEYLQMDHQ